MHSIAEKHYECVTRRIDPERSSGKTRVTKRAEREQIAFVCRVTRGNVPAEAAGAIFTGSSWLGHRGDREGAENPRALIGSAAQDHLTIGCQVVGGGKQSCVPRDATHPE